MAQNDPSGQAEPKPLGSAQRDRGRYLYVAQMDIPPEHEDEFNRIYDTEHVPQILEVPGVISCSRYLIEHSTKDGIPRYAAIYELDSPEVIKSPEWRAAADRGEWKPKIRPHTTNRQHHLFRLIAGPTLAKRNEK